MKTNKAIGLASTLCLCLALISPTVAAQDLYGIDRGGDQLLKIDPVTGNVVEVGYLGFNVGESGAAFSGDGTLYVFSVHESLPDTSYLYTVDLDTAKPRWIQSFRRVVGVGLSFGPDGETLFLREGDMLYTLDVKKGRLKRFASLPDGAFNLALSTDCESFYSRSIKPGQRGQYLTRIEANRKATVTEIGFIAGRVVGISNLASAPDGTLYSIFGIGPGHPWLWEIDPDTGAGTPIAPTDGYRPNALVFGPDEVVSCPPVPPQPGPCPDTVVIDGCDTGVFALLADGTCLQHVVDYCAAGAKNHGDYVSCVARATAELMQEGLLTGREKGLIDSCAGQSSIGKP
ncbi:MAG: PQQ-like beta-propeller repeat protein [Acidobacteriota bacterium]|nr:MAG: PQQ-like beta-propeller repeat protein [Acidobacteriota bacterium]